MYHLIPPLQSVFQKETQPLPLTVYTSLQDL